MRKIGKRIALIIFILLPIIIISGILLSKEIKKSLYPIRYEEYVVKYSDEYEVPKDLIYAVIYSESHFNEEAYSSAGAMGLMQIMPDTFTWLTGHIGENYGSEDIYNPEINIRLGVYYLSYLYRRFESWDTAIAGYNAGHGNVTNWLADTRYSEDGKTLKYIPIGQTRGYVVKVNKVRDIYTELYFSD